MKKNSLRLCPICSCNLCEVLHNQRFVLPAGHPLSNGYDVVCCEKCGFVYADTIVTQKDYDEFYAKWSKYEDSNTSTGSGETELDALRLQQTASFIASFLPDKKVQVLDIGCANGGLLKSLKSLGYLNVKGIDPSPTCVKNAIEYSGIQASIGSISSIADNPTKYDCVILSHVMEHVQNINEAVYCISNILHDSGLVYIEVPDATRYSEYLFAPFQDFNTEHINHFSPICLSNLFLKSSYNLLDFGNKEILISPGMKYPVIYGVFTKLTNTNQNEAINKDNYLIKQTKKYIFRSQALMDKMNDRIKEILFDSPEIIVWGTGQLAMKLLAETCLREAKIVAFVDGNPINQGKYIRGIPIRAPQQITGLTYPILITSTLHKREIESAIQKMGLPNKTLGLNLDTWGY